MQFREREKMISFIKKKKGSKFLMVSYTHPLNNGPEPLAKILNCNNYICIPGISWVVHFLTMSQLIQAVKSRFL